jgi:hypothetical protein
MCAKFSYKVFHALNLNVFRSLWYCFIIDFSDLRLFNLLNLVVCINCFILLFLLLFFDFFLNFFWAWLFIILRSFIATWCNHAWTIAIFATSPSRVSSWPSDLFFVERCLGNFKLIWSFFAFFMGRMRIWMV